MPSIRNRRSTRRALRKKGGGKRTRRTRRTRRIRQRGGYVFNGWQVNSWDDYYEALTRSCQTEDYGVDYPQYEELQDDRGIDADIEIVTSLLNDENLDLDAQEGLNGLFQALIDGSRYSPEFIGNARFPELVNLYIQEGANIADELDTILQANQGINHFEDEIQSYNARAALLKLIKNSFMENLEDILNHRINWNELEAADEEEFLDIEFANENEFDRARFRVLKYEYENI
jgi:hypothetical protein